MNTVERLLAATSDMWKVYNEHPFVLGIQNGTLDYELAFWEMSWKLRK